MKTAYIDMIGGVSGDMLLGALVDAGLPIDELRSELSGMDVRGYTLRAERVSRGALNCTLVHVDLDDEGLRRRGWDELSGTIESSRLPDEVRSKAIEVLDRLTAAESVVHGVDRHHLTPHELGTVDTLVDIVGVIAGFRLLGVQHIAAGPFPAGTGFVMSDHGRIPGIAPATAQIYAAAGAPVRSASEWGPKGETVTPSGAALVTSIASFKPIDIRVNQISYGAGSRNPEDYPNAVGLWLGEMPATSALRSPDAGLSLLETNIDDMGGELFGYVQERLLEAGALDVWMTPIQMKKNRPAVLLSALVKEGDADSAANVILRETSTLGVRRRSVERYTADREIVEVDTTLGVARVKIKRVDGEVAGVAPEYEDCRTLALKHGLTLAEVMRRVADEARAGLQD
ncbi:MAG: nickel pincer cofactor biosynthesis protein LarC [Chloroflexi bacterium]|nr:nickel pincer cofactor biosynthesis protein LarC [Chloroflexota bacterium]